MPAACLFGPKRDQKGKHEVSKLKFSKWKSTSAVMNSFKKKRLEMTALPWENYKFKVKPLPQISQYLLKRDQSWIFFVFFTFLIGWLSILSK